MGFGTGIVVGAASTLLLVVIAKAFGSTAQDHAVAQAPPVPRQLGGALVDNSIPPQTEEVRRWMAEDAPWVRGGGLQPAVLL